MVPTSKARTEPAGEVRQGRIGTDGLPLYQRLVRREARIWPDQRVKLMELVELAKARKTEAGGDRITDATLTRVGIDVLSLLADDLSGNDEAELGAAVTAAVDDLLSARALLREQWPNEMAKASVTEMVTFLIGVAKKAKAVPKPAK